MSGDPTSPTRALVFGFWNSPGHLRSPQVTSGHLGSPGQGAARTRTADSDRALWPWPVSSAGCTGRFINTQRNSRDSGESYICGAHAVVGELVCFPRVCSKNLAAAYVPNTPLMLNNHDTAARPPAHEAQTTTKT